MYTCIHALAQRGCTSALHVRALLRTSLDCFCILSKSCWGAWMCNHVEPSVWHVHLLRFHFFFICIYFQEMGKLVSKFPKGVWYSYPSSLTTVISEILFNPYFSFFHLKPSANRESRTLWRRVNVQSNSSHLRGEWEGQPCIWVGHETFSKTEKRYNLDYGRSSPRVKMM